MAGLQKLGSTPPCGPWIGPIGRVDWVPTLRAIVFFPIFLQRRQDFSPHPKRTGSQVMCKGRTQIGTARNKSAQFERGTEDDVQVIKQENITQGK